MKSQYWVFDESVLDAALRHWSADPRHSDTSEEACKARFESVSNFLYSDIAENKGLYQIFDIKRNHEVHSDQ
ncbi:MAG: hypothetical protein AB2604_10745 [Candidatus Thiodiazotropha taylori]